jgi:hypothetical protein
MEEIMIMTMTKEESLIVLRRVKPIIYLVKTQEILTVKTYITYNYHLTLKVNKIKF